MFLPFCQWLKLQEKSSNFGSIFYVPALIFACESGNQVQVSRAKTVGGYHLMQGENPIYICSFDFTGEVS